MRRASLTIAAVALLAGQAQAAPTCATPEQVDQVLHFIAPNALSIVSQHCRTLLPADSFLSSGGEALATRLRSTTPVGIGDLRTALSAMMGRDLPTKITDDQLANLVTESGTLGDLTKLTARSCGDASALIEQLSYLPPEHLYRLISVILDLATRKDSNMHLCERNR